MLVGAGHDRPDPGPARQGRRHGRGLRQRRSGSLFGASGSANFLSRTTAVLAAVFFVCTLALAYFGNMRVRPGGGSVLERAAATAPAPAPAPPSGAAQIPAAPVAPARRAAPPQPPPPARQPRLRPAQAQIPTK